MEVTVPVFTEQCSSSFAQSQGVQLPEGLVWTLKGLRDLDLDKGFLMKWIHWWDFYGQEVKCDQYPKPRKQASLQSKCQIQTWQNVKVTIFNSKNYLTFSQEVHVQRQKTSCGKAGCPQTSRPQPSPPSYQGKLTSLNSHWVRGTRKCLPFLE